MPGAGPATAAPRAVPISIAASRPRMSCAIERAVHLVAESWIIQRIRAAPTRAEAIAVARRECSLGGTSSLGFQISGFRDRFNKGRGLAVEFGHRKGVVTWAAIADYVR